MSIAVITARGGSKGLPRKNVLPLLGKPLIVWTIEAALASRVIKRTVVSTDDDEISQTALQAGAEVLRRPADLATDKASSLDVLAHALQSMEAAKSHKEFVLLQPTSPLRQASHIDAMVHRARQLNAGSALSVTPIDHHPWKMLLRDVSGYLVPSHSKEMLSAPRQSLPIAFRQNGAMYWGRVEDFLRTRQLHIDPVLGFEMSEESSVDVDVFRDLQECGRLLKAS